MELKILTTNPIELNTNLIPIFGGNYNTEWEVYEIDDDNQELDLDYKFEDLMKSILKAYQDQSYLIEAELKDLGIDFLSKIKFISTYSPREYNFETDSINFECEVDENKLLRKIGEIDNEEFRKFLDDNFSDRDGFMSFTPNTIDKLVKAIADGNGQYNQAIGAVCQYILRNDYGNIEQEVREYWNSNGYLGLDYKIIKED